MYPPRPTDIIENIIGDFLPAADQVFAAFDLCPFDTLRVVIVGQDPYHDIGQAHGLAFSVPTGVRVPPSLRNIFCELEQDLGIPADGRCGNLQSWATDGVLLLNSVLTVAPHMPASHHDIGWQQYTDSVIASISDNKKHVVFVLWGDYARSKSHLIDTSKHHIVESSHPSPLSAYRGFTGSKPFSQINNYLVAHNLPPVNW